MEEGCRWEIRVWVVGWWFFNDSTLEKYQIQKHILSLQFVKIRPTVGKHPIELYKIKLSWISSYQQSGSWSRIRLEVMLSFFCFQLPNNKVHLAFKVRDALNTQYFQQTLILSAEGHSLSSIGVVDVVFQIALYKKKLFRSHLCKKKNYDTHSSLKKFIQKTLQLPRS